MRETGVVRKRFGGDTEAAKEYQGIARTQLGIMKNLMQLGGLQQLHRTIELSDGTRIFVQSVFGQDTIRIDVPPGIKAGGGAVTVKKYQDKVVDYVGVAMPNPVPYRGVSIGLVGSANAATGSATYVMVSDGQVLASEPYTVDGVTYPGYGSAKFQSYTVIMGGSWNGEGPTWMFQSNPIQGTWYFDHILYTEAIPEDCIYPIPQTDAPTYPGTDGLSAQWNTYWQAGVTAFKARRKAWFLKNSDEFIAAAKGKFQPGAEGVTRAELQTGKIPASWDYAIKTHCYTSFKTYQPILMNASYVDAVTSDTSADLTVAGTKITKRTVTFDYVDAAGMFKQKVIDGTVTQAVPVFSDTPHAEATTDTYINWYADYFSYPGPVAGWGTEAFYKDRVTNAPLGLLWSGVRQNGNYRKDSAFGTPTNPLTYILLTPAYPTLAYGLISTAPDFILEYHNTVLPKYHSETPSATHDGNTAWNNSSMYNVKQVELCLFGPAPGGVAIGIFADPADADGATQIAYYGEVSCSFDWSTGEIKVTNWTPKKDEDGNDAPKIVPLQAGFSYFTYTGATYFVQSVKTTIAGTGQTPTSAGAAAYTAVYNGIPYTVAAKTAAANIIKSAVAAAAPIDPSVTPLVASPANITAILPGNVTAAVAAVLATYVSPATPPDAAQVKYYILNSIQTLVPTYNCAIGYVWDKPNDLWKDVDEYLVAKIKAMVAGGGDQVLYTVIKQALALPPNPL